MNKVKWPSSYLPDSAVWLSPEVAGSVDECLQQFPVILTYVTTDFYVVVGCFEYLTENIQLALMIGIVANAYRSGIAIAL